MTTIAELADWAHRAGAPVICVQHSSDEVLPGGSEDWLLHPGPHPG